MAVVAELDITQVAEEEIMGLPAGKGAKDIVH